MSEENLDRIYSMPWVVPGSDASLRAPWGPLGEDHPHPRAYGTMPEFFRRVTDPSKGVAVSSEEAVARMTSVPARRFAIKGRGILEKGAFADIAVWRRDAFRNTATYDRSHSFCTGMEKVFVNGVLAYDGGAFTRSGSGRFLER
jgi:N-acyl-D-aspartate/D-glutamate deacylase